jgi:hypothetical protein
MSKFFVIVDPDSTDAFLDISSSVPTVFESEKEAIAAAKNYSASAYVVKATAYVEPVERHKVTKLA